MCDMKQITRTRTRPETVFYTASGPKSEVGCFRSGKSEPVDPGGEGVRAVIQRVAEASVTIGEHESGRIGRGLLVLVGVGPGDDARDARKTALDFLREVNQTQSDSERSAIFQRV